MKLSSILGFIAASRLKPELEGQEIGMETQPRNDGLLSNVALNMSTLCGLYCSLYALQEKQEKTITLQMIDSLHSAGSPWGVHACSRSVRAGNTQ